MKTKKSLLIYTNLFPNPGDKHRGVFTKQLTDSLTKYYNVTVVSPVACNPVSYFINFFRKNRFQGKKISYEKYNVYYPQYLIIPKIFRSLHWLSMFLSTYFLVRKLNKDHSFEIISSHWVYPDAAAAVIIAKLIKVKVAVHALGCDVNDYIKYFSRRFIIKKTLEHADLIIPVSRALKEVIENDLHVDNNIEVIMNGVNSDVFMPFSKSASRKKLGIPQDQKVLLFVGNFQIEKGLEYLLDALSIVHKKNTDIFLYVVGGGRLQSKIESKIKSLGLSENVILIGKVKHELLPEYFSAANYLCLPSLREGCPNVVLESLSCGTPVIASNVGTVPDIIIPGQLGFIHEPQNIEEMADIISSAFHESFIENTREFSWFTWDDNTQYTYDAYEAISTDH